MLHRFRINYWSCSNFADWVRGEKKPLALGLDEWEEWRINAKSKHPIRYFIAESVLDTIQNLVLFPVDLLRTTRNWWHNRFVHKTHFLKTGLKPGVFHELDERILYGLFNEFKEFVEVDLALSHNDPSLKFKNGRCPEAGLAHLEWASKLRHGDDDFVSKGSPEYGKPTPQAKSAIEIMKLYKWWTETRPSRPDPYEVSGAANFCDGEKISKKAKKSCFDKLYEIEKAYEDEDEKMLVKLIRIRKHLWT